MKSQDGLLASQDGWLGIRIVVLASQAWRLDKVRMAGFAVLASQVVLASQDGLLAGWEPGLECWQVRIGVLQVRMDFWQVRMAGWESELECWQVRIGTKWLQDMKFHQPATKPKRKDCQPNSVHASQTVTAQQFVNAFELLLQTPRLTLYYENDTGMILVVAPHHHPQIHRWRRTGSQEHPQG